MAPIKGVALTANGIAKGIIATGGGIFRRGYAFIIGYRRNAGAILLGDFRPTTTVTTGVGGVPKEG